MRALLVVVLVSILAACSAGAAPHRWAAPKSLAVPAADGYVEIPNAALRPKPSQTFRAIYDATHAADQPSHLVPAVNMAGSELNVLASSGVPLRNARFVVVFHGAAMDGLLNDAAYKAKFGMPNPNLKTMAQMRKSGVEFYVCGQNLAAEDIDPASLTRDVTVATDALIVLMVYQNQGYALLSF